MTLETAARATKEPDAVRHEVVVVADLRKDTTHQRGNNKDDCYYLSVQPPVTHTEDTQRVLDLSQEKRRYDDGYIRTTSQYTQRAHTHADIHKISDDFVTSFPFPPLLARSFVRSYRFIHFPPSASLLAHHPGNHPGGHGLSRVARGAL
jgi:hypothetical protein